MTSQNAYASRLQSLRCGTLHLTQAEFGKLIGKDTSQVCRWETGDRRIDADAVIHIAKRLGLDPVEELRKGGFIE